MRFLVTSISTTRMEMVRRWLPDAELFQGTVGCDESNYRTDCIPKTNHRLAAYAVKHKLGRETVVLQDDVWLPHGGGFEDWNRSYWNPLVVYGTRRDDGHVCPKAYSAEPWIWKLILGVWDGKGRVCPAWRPIVDEHGLVLNVTHDLGGRSAPCVGCRH